MREKSQDIPIDEQIQLDSSIEGDAVTKSGSPYTQEEKDKAIKVFLTLIKWRNEAREKGLIDW